jgi:hypothetical protein
LKKDKVTVLPPPRILQTLPHVISFCFRNWNPSLLGGNTSSAIHQYLLLCTKQRTVTPSRSGYIGWNFAFLATGSTSKAWNIIWNVLFLSCESPFNDKNLIVNDEKIDW